MKDWWFELQLCWNNFWWNYIVSEIHSPSGRVVRKTKRIFRFFTKKNNEFKKIVL